MKKTNAVKRTILVALMALMLLFSSGFAPGKAGTGEQTDGVITANIGDAEFSFTNELEYYDVSYKYPEEFELEIKEDSTRVRNLLRYHVEGFDPTAVGIVVSRTDYYPTPEDRLKDVKFIDEVTTEEINGVPWAIGKKDDGSVIIYACAAGGYVYTFSFSTDFPADFDFADFARAFAEGITVSA